MANLTAYASTVLSPSGVDLAARVARLAEIRSSDLVRQASERTEAGVERSLPLAAALRPLFPTGGLRRGSTISVLSGSPASSRPGEALPGAASAGSTSLLLTLLAEASAAGSWCAIVGLPRLGLVAAAEAGLALERVALVPAPGPDWAGVVAALLDGVDIVVLATPGGVSAQIATRLTARARQRGVVFVSVGQWPGADLVLASTSTTWHGLGQGRGRLRSRQTEVVAHGRGAATRARRVQLQFPAPATVSGPLLPAVVHLPAGRPVPLELAG